jgi:ATP-binding cassette, subfamily B, bacterial PglK
MSSLLKYLREIIFLIGEDRKKIKWMALAFFSLSIFDLVGIGLIVPYIALITNPEIFTQSNLYPLFVSIGFSPNTDEALITLGYLLLTIFFLKAVSVIWINRTILRFCFRIGSKLRSLLMRSYQDMSYSEYTNRNSSEYVYNIQSLANQYSQVILQSLLRLISDGVVGVMILILLAWNNGPAFLLLILLLGGLVLAYDIFFRKRVHLFGKLSNDYSTKMLQGVHEGMEGFKEIRILGKKGFFYNTVKENAKRYSEIGAKSLVISTAPRYLLEFILVLFMVLLTFIAITLEQDSTKLIATFSMFGIASIRLIPSVNQVISGITQLRFGRHGVGLLYSDMRKIDDLSKKNRLTNDSFNPDKQKLFESIALQNIDFSYLNKGNKVLKGISIKIKAGESIGIVGSSGSGKTTVVDLMLGLLDPDEGMVLYNGTPLKENLAQWHSQVAYLPQQIFLIDNTLRNNIALGVKEEEINNVMIEEALNQSRLMELVKQLPNGVDTILGERGIRLSGGQRQRVALARAFYHQRSVLVMDESTSALDNETEREIVKEIKLLKGKKTVIVVAHRLTTVQHCDRIYRLDNGKIIESGSYKSVIGDKL